MTSLDVTVLVCTYNPVPESLARCLRALRDQTLGGDCWELLLIDNCSREPVKDRFDLSWQPRGRHLRVDTLGKTHAIAEGVRQAIAPVLAIVDDDNILAPDYLQTVKQIMEDHPFLGVIGGHIRGEFETPPSPWAQRYLPLLALSTPEDTRPRYSCSPDKSFVPPGAGTAIRKRVVEFYLDQIAHDPIRQGLDPVGDQLSRAGDTDMALCAWDLQLAKGYFPSLKLTHLIPAKRLEPDYLAKLFEGTAYCDTLLQLIRKMVQPEDQSSFWRRCVRHLKWRLTMRHLNRQQLKIDLSGRRGMMRAHRFFLQQTRRDPDV